MRALLAWTLVVSSCGLIAACGDDDGPTMAPPMGRDSGMDGGQDGGPSEGGAPPIAGSGVPLGDGMAPPIPEDGSTPFDANFDAMGDYPDAFMGTPDLPVPDAWKNGNCSEALWQDTICDCGCNVSDADCVESSCSEPGCREATCDACFDENGAWMPCTEPPDASDWTCSSTEMSNTLCDCGCGIPDVACGLAGGCTSPGCRAPACTFRHGCMPGVTTNAADDCSSTDPGILSQWNCPREAYGGEDGCDCGCGIIDPDCGGDGCTNGRCYDDACTTCHDENGRPYNCAAAREGWDDDTSDGTPSLDPSKCDSWRFDAADGCDCGCGGIDPDCGSDGCAAEGCNESACERCTDGSGQENPLGTVVGCAVDGAAAGAWEVNGCNMRHYGSGDGCDCGCGAPDPDCDGDGSTDNAFTADCDACHDGAGSYDACPGWTCAQDPGSNPECDCGCGVVDPFCRDDQRASCTENGCEVTTCQFCNDNDVRMACGGEWTSNSEGSPCSRGFYDLDGLCDCGCGVADPDCAQDDGCTGSGCVAPGCDVCHYGVELTQCLVWTCETDALEDDACDCGCGAPDPACDGSGCTEVGCFTAACEVCRDNFARPTPCPVQ